MDKNTISPVTIARVAFEHEAVTLVAALKDSGIAAYFQQIASVGLLALPGAFGMPQNGFEIVVSESDEDRAADIVAGLGITDADCDGGEADGDDDAAPLDESVDDEAETAIPDGEAADSENELQADASVADDELPESSRSPFASAILTILALVGIAAFVWLCDWVIELVTGLLK